MGLGKALRGSAKFYRARLKFRGARPSSMGLGKALQGSKKLYRAHKMLHTGSVKLYGGLVKLHKAW